MANTVLLIFNIVQSRQSLQNITISGSEILRKDQIIKISQPLALLSLRLNLLGRDHSFFILVGVIRFGSCAKISAFLNQNILMVVI